MRSLISSASLSLILQSQPARSKFCFSKRIYFGLYRQEEGEGEKKVVCRVIAIPASSGLLFSRAGWSPSALLIVSIMPETGANISEAAVGDASQLDLEFIGKFRILKVIE